MASIIELLQKVQLIDDRAHEAVLSRAKSRSGGHIVQQVAELGFATESTIARAISVELALPRIDLQMTPPEQAAVALLDARTCAERFVLPVALRENGELLWLAMADPTDQDSIGVVARRTHKRVRPAVAGPSEILRAVRQLYGAPGAGAQQQPEEPPADKLAAIELEDASREQVEIVNLMDDSASPALTRIASQLGVSVPEDLPSRRRHAQPIDVSLDPESPEDHPSLARATPSKPVPKIPPPTPAPPTGPTPAKGTARVAPKMKDLFATTAGGPIAGDDLTDDDLTTLDVIRQSLEKGAVVLRAVAELCVEKTVFTLKEMRRNR